MCVTAVSFFCLPSSISMGGATPTSHLYCNYPAVLPSGWRRVFPGSSPYPLQNSLKLHISHKQLDWETMAWITIYILEKWHSDGWNESSRWSLVGLQAMVDDERFTRRKQKGTWIRVQFQVFWFWATERNKLLIHQKRKCAQYRFSCSFLLCDYNLRIKTLALLFKCNAGRYQKNIEQNFSRIMIYIMQQSK